ERGNAETRVRIRDLRTGAEHYVKFDEPIFTLARGSTPDYNTSTLRLNYASFVTPTSVYDYDMASRKLTLLKRTEVLGGYDPSLYTQERTWATATDGTKIPISLVYRKPLVRDGKRPLFLYASGSYGSSTDPSFASNLPKNYAYMITYSPYDNVAAKAYPNLLVTTSLNDPRVAYWEPAKWVAKLRATKTDGNLLILRTNMGAGHGGSSGRYDALHDQA